MDDLDTVAVYNNDQQEQRKSRHENTKEVKGLEISSFEKAQKIIVI